MLTQIWQGILEAIQSDFTVGLLVTVILAGLAWVLKPVRLALLSLWQHVTKLWQAQNRIDRALQQVRGNGVWLSPVSAWDSEALTRAEASIPILTVANLKGGVGKTTTAANLAGYFADERGKRVLVIDLDFQGSLSSKILKRQHSPIPGTESGAATLVQKRLSPTSFLSTLKRSGDVERLHCVNAYYDLARAETQSMVEWLLGDEAEDIRFRLRDLLHSPEIRQAFDLVIIDAPPRMTTGAVQAFCASKYLLIPTVLDELSGETVATFIQEIETLKENNICPRIQIVGIVGSMVSANIERKMEQDPEADPRSFLALSEREGLAAISTALQRGGKDQTGSRAGAPILPLDVFIQKLASISADSASSLVFPKGSEAAKDMYRRLGRQVELFFREN